ncbi:MAG TPA: hypothetical protein DEB46_01435 [Myxococcales bacterium]|nr:hypothetical protein [Myxococcales bacterium]HBU46948.1 hypothetical protein [Myxococcales bacterium]
MRIFLSLALLGLGCYEAPTFQPTQMMDHHWSPGGQRQSKGPATLHPDDIVYGKIPRRLRVDQLRRTIPMLFNGLTWTDPSGNDQFATMVATLGEADYEERYEDEAAPSPLFAKFMDDMAGQVCGKAVALDGQEPDPTQRILIPFPNDIFKNLRFLRLKFHGIHVPEDSSVGLLELRELYRSVQAETSALDGWNAVCVAMLTAPEFMTY